MPTLTTEAALLAAVCRDPDDLAARLACADRCDETGDGARAEFIRVQLTLVTTKRDPKRHLAIRDGRWREVDDDCGDCRWCALRRREQELLDAHGDDWRLDVTRRVGCPFLAPHVFRHGFVEAVTLSCAAWLAHGPALVQAAPLTEVRLGDRKPQHFHTGLAERPEDFGWWRSGALGPVRAHDIPPALCRHTARFPGVEIHGRWTDFPTEAAARAALSAAAIAYAREKAGLPPLPRPLDAGAGGA